METKIIKKINALVKQTEEAAKLVTHNRFLIETYVSLLEAKSGKGKTYKSIPDLFNKLGV